MKKMLSLVIFAAMVLFSCQLQPKENTFSMNGAVQKGPFQLGSTVTIQEVDKKLNPTGRMYYTTTKDDFGSFNLANKFSSQFVEVTSEGFYFDECANNTASAKISLRSYGDLSLNTPLNLNILTTIAHGRIKTLVDNGKDFAQACNQAESELLAVLGFSGVPGLHFYEFSLESGGNDAALLLAVSATCQKGRSVAQLSQFIADLAQDFQDDGNISNSSLITQIRTGASALNVTTIINNLKSHYVNRGKTIDVPDFSNYRNILMIAGGVIGKPVFSLESGTYIEEKAITITAPAGAEIRYTIDGSTPTANSILYTNPVIIRMNSDVTLKAVSILNNVVSSVTQARYIIKEGRCAADYFITTPGKYIEYEYTGYDRVSDPKQYSGKLFAVVQKGNESNPYNISININRIDKYCYAYITASSNGYVLKGASIGGPPYFAWYLYQLQRLPENIILNEQYVSDKSITYNPSYLSSWRNFSDLIQIDFDSTSIVSGKGTNLDDELRGTGKFIYARGIGLVYFEIIHTASSTNPLNKKDIFEYSNHGDAPLVTFTGTYTSLGLPAIGHMVAPASVLTAIPSESYSTINTDSTFEFKQYAVPGSYFMLSKIVPSPESYHNFRVLIPASPSIINMGEIGAIPDWGVATVY
jgi:hypothetical protein